MKHEILVANKALVIESNEKLYTLFLEKVNDIIESTAKRMQHEMSPETKKRFDEFDKEMANNKDEHNKIMEMLLKLEQKYETHYALLEEIKENTIARNKIREFIQNWWLVGTVIFGIISLYVKSLLSK